MTGEEWPDCSDPLPMLGFIRGIASDRKLRLFAVACCRTLWPATPPDAVRETIEVNERYADGRASDKELGRSRSAAHTAAWNARYRLERVPLTPDGNVFTQHVAERADAPPEHLRRLYFVAFMANPTARLRADEMPMLLSDPLLSRSSPATLRDLFGNPFRPAAFDPAWRTPAVLDLAAAAYDLRDMPAGLLDPARLAVLSDALEEAGCTEGEILSHLRGPGPHVRGCFALDLVLGRE